MATTRKPTDTVDVTSGPSDRAADDIGAASHTSFTSQGAIPPVRRPDSGHVAAATPSASELAFDDGASKNKEKEKSAAKAPNLATAKGKEPDERETEPKFRRIPLRQGLIHGEFQEQNNSIDLHVDAKGEGGGMQAIDMLAMAKHCRNLMSEREESGGPKGTFMLHPTGPAITKIFVELLATALGGKWDNLKAQLLQKKRKTFGNATGARNPDKLDPSVQPEHFAFLDSMRGKDVSIVPRLTGRYNTEDNYNQDMMQKTPEGEARYAQYKQVLQASDDESPVGPGLDVTLTSDQLPAVIKVLESRV
jgi:hypothetical protein